jgi:uncharacterized protein (DUF362 family)
MNMAISPRREVSTVETQHASTSSKVAVVYTRPETVFDDVAHAMRMAGYESHLPKDVDTLLKINISWQHYYPACSSTPWQLEGVIKTLQADGYEKLIPTHNGTVVVDAREGAIKNKHQAVEDKYGLESLHLEKTKWIDFVPQTELIALDKVYPDGFQIPEALIGKNIVHLPTMKTHVFTTITGAMKNAFGGLLNHNRHWTHPVIHETLVDLLAIQKQIHPGIFAVTDGTLAGDGPGPRAMRWHMKNVILASADQVAIDAVAAKMMGFDPMSIRFIRLAHDRGLGCGDIRRIEVVGEDISGVNWGFTGAENTLFSNGQKMVYWGPLKSVETLLARSPLVNLGIAASNLYHNGYWLPVKGRKRVREALKTEWGKLFQSY